MALTKKAARFFFEVLRENQDLPGLKALVRRMRPRDWSSLSVLADTSELSPIFYLRLSALDLEEIDPALRSSLKEAYILNLGRTILREKELSKIVTALNAAGIPAMPLKGPVFSVLLFDDIASRFTYYDLDVLVQQTRLKEAEETLKTIGFAIEMSSEVESFCRSNYSELTWVTQSESLGRLSLDLHWRLSNDVLEENIVNEVWSGAKSITIEQTGYLVPSPEDLFVYLIFKSVPGNYKIHIKSLYDLHRCFTKFRGSFDMAKLRDKISRSGAAARLGVAREFAGKLFDTPLVPELAGLCRLPYTKKTAIRCFANTQNCAESFMRRDDLRRFYFFRIVVCNYIFSNNAGDFMRRVFRKLFIPIEEFAIYHPEATGDELRRLYTRRFSKMFWNR